MDSRTATLKAIGDDLFEKRESLVSLWQDVAENFYPERADFTTIRSLGTDFADQLLTSYPLIARRDLGNAFSAMLRPSSKNWFKIGTTRDDRIDEPGRAWLDYAAGVQRRAMYDRNSQFVRATKEGDHDFAAFGQAALTIEPNRNRDGLLYRCWHLRDVAWQESAEGKVDTVHRKWKPSARALCKMFPNTVDEKVRKLLDKTPFATVEVRHAVMPAEDYEAPVGKRWRFPFVSVFFDVENGSILEEISLPQMMYVIPRWQTVSGSQYAYSPAVVAALPEARLIQAITLTLLEAGEKAANPPMLATQEALRSDLALMAGGVTYIESDYDERTGLAIRPIAQDYRGLPTAMEMSTASRQIISECFFLNKLTLPQPGSNPEMTAFEAGQRVQEYIRNALPLFEPMEMEYNAAVCDLTFEILQSHGAFGPVTDIPRSLGKADIQFRFESPLSQAIDAEKGQQMIQAKTMLAQVIDLDPSAAAMLDAQVMLRDALRGTGIPAKWLRTEEQMAAVTAEHAQQAQADQLLGGVEKSAGIAKTLGQASQAFRAGGADQGGGQPAAA